MRYRVNEIFLSVQGEGSRVGTANVFVRFSGCNMKCPFCDTRHSEWSEMGASDIAVRVLSLMPRNTKVVLTGGEPCLQYDSELATTLALSGVSFIAMETNGSVRPRARVDWVSCSPKVPEEVVMRNFPGGVHEIKYVIDKDSGLPPSVVPAGNRFLSPEFGRRGPRKGALERCLELVLGNPEWRLTTQNQKYWRVR